MDVWHVRVYIFYDVFFFRLGVDSETKLFKKKTVESTLIRTRALFYWIFPQNTMNSTQNKKNVFFAPKQRIYNDIRKAMCTEKKWCFMVCVCVHFGEETNNVIKILAWVTRNWCQWQYTYAYIEQTLSRSVYMCLQQSTMFEYPYTARNYSYTKPTVGRRQKNSGNKFMSISQLKFTHRTFSLSMKLHLVKLS